MVPGRRYSWGKKKQRFWYWWRWVADIKAKEMACGLHDLDMERTELFVALFSLSWMECEKPAARSWGHLSSPSEAQVVGNWDSFQKPEEWRRSANNCRGSHLASRSSRPGETFRWPDDLSPSQSFPTPSWETPSKKPPVKLPLDFRPAETTWDNTY